MQKWEYLHHDKPRTGQKKQNRKLPTEGQTVTGNLTAHPVSFPKVSLWGWNSQQKHSP